MSWWHAYIPTAWGNIVSKMYPSQPTVGPVAWEAPEGPLNIVELDGVPIDYGNRGVTDIPFNPYDMSLPTLDKNRAAAAVEEAKEVSGDPVYHQAFTKLYPEMNFCIQDQKHGKNNPDAVRGCEAFAERGDMSMLVLTDRQREALPVIERISKEIPQDAKSDLIKYLEYEEATTFTLRDKAADWSQNFMSYLVGEGTESGEAAGAAVGGAAKGLVGGIGTGFREGLDFRSFDEKLDPLINPDPKAPKISGTMLMAIGGGVLLLILLMRK